MAASGPSSNERKMPELERKKTLFDHKLHNMQEINNKLDSQITSTRAAVQENLEWRKEVGQPRSYIRGVGANSIFKEMTKHNAKNIHWLEDKRDRALKAHDKARAEMAALREEINKQRRSHMQQHIQWKAVKNDLVEVRTGIEESMQRANEIMELKTEIDEEIEDIKETDAEEQKAFEIECQKLSRYINERLEQAAYLDSESVDEEQHGGLSKDEETKLKEQMERLEIQMKLQSMKETHAQRKTSSYQEAFAKLKAITGITDIERLVDMFIEEEDRNFALFRYIQNVNREIKTVTVASDAIAREVKRLKDHHGSQGASKMQTLSHLESKAAKIRAEAAVYKQKHDKLETKMFEHSRRVASLFRAAGCGDLPDAGPEGEEGSDRPKSRESRPGSRDSRRRGKGGLEAVIAADKRAQRRSLSRGSKRRGSSASLAGSVRSSAEMETLTQSSVSEHNIVKFLGVVEETATGLLGQFRKTHLANQVEMDEPDVLEAPKVPFQKRRFHIALPDTEDEDSAFHHLAGLDEDRMSEIVGGSPTRSTSAARNSRRRQSQNRVGKATSVADPGFASVKPMNVEEAKREIESAFASSGFSVKQFVRPGKGKQPQPDNKKSRKRNRTVNLTATLGGARPKSVVASRSQARVGVPTRPQSQAARAGGALSQSMPALGR